MVVRLLSLAQDIFVTKIDCFHFVDYSFCNVFVWWTSLRVRFSSKIVPKMSYYHFYSVLCLLSIVLVTVTSSSTNLSPVFWIPSGQSHNRVERSPYTTHSTLLSNIKCKDDLRRLCPNLNSNNDDLTVLECIQTAKVRFNSLFL